MAAWSTVDQNNAFARANHAFSHLIGARIARYLADSAAQSRHVDAAIALTSPGAGDNQPGSIDNIGDTMLVARAAAFTTRAGFRHETDACAEAAADLQVATQSWQRVSPPGMASWRVRLMRAYTELSCGRYDVLYSRHEAAISRFQAGATLIESVLEERPGHSSALETQARISLASAGSWKARGKAAKAEQMYETAIDQATQLLAKLAIDPYRGLRASARLGYARFLLRHGRRFDAAGSQLDLAESDIDPIRMFDPITHRAAACFVRAGIAILGRAPQGEVERACAAAVDVHRALLETRPNPGNRLSLGAALANHGACLLQRNADSEAAMLLIEALALNDSAERANPSLSGVWANRQTQTKNLVAAVAKLERRGQSDAIADIAVRLQDQLHQDRELTINAVQFLCSAIGTARRQGGNAVAAEPQRIATAVTWLSTAIESSPTPVELASVRDDPKLAVLRGHPRFDELLAGLEKRK